MPPPPKDTCRPMRSPNMVLGGTSPYADVSTGNPSLWNFDQTSSISFQNQII